MLSDDYYTVTQAAREIGVSRPTIYRWIRDGLYAERVGGVVLVLKCDVKSAVCPTCGARRIQCVE